MVKPKALKSAAQTNSKRQLIIIVLLVLAAVLIIPQIDDLSDTWSVVAKAQPFWVAIAVVCLVVTYPVAGLIYQILSMKPLPFGRTILIQAASMFAGRVLPAGAGEMGVNYLYLRRQKHGRAQSAAVIATNNSLGFVSNALLLFGFLLAGSPLPKLHIAHLRSWTVLIVGLLVLIVGIVLKTPFGRRVQSPLKALGVAIASYRKRWWSIMLAIAVAMLLTVVYTCLLYASARSVGSHLTLAAAFVVMSLGVVGASVTPTPGGLGGAEAALAASLVLYHISTSHAVAIAIVYRIVTYWIGLTIGAVALLIARQRKYI